MASGAAHSPPRLYRADSEVEAVMAGLIARTLPRPAWTHEAHLAALSGILLTRPDIVPEQELPGIIARYNAAVGGVNDDSQGYHETLTQFWIRVARAFHRRSRGSLVARANSLIAADPEGRRDYPLTFWSEDRLFSVEARRQWVEPDRMRFGIG